MGKCCSSNNSKRKNSDDDIHKAKANVNMIIEVKKIKLKFYYEQT